MTVNTEAGMQSFWEQTGILGPIYRLLGQGIDDTDIAKTLNLTELKVQTCVAWIAHFLNLKSRQDLVLYASSAV
jgi:DNA-binding NarL/FixJ family response regulator